MRHQTLAWLLWGLCLLLAPLGDRQVGAQAYAQDQNSSPTEYLMVGYTPRGHVPGVVVYRLENGILRGRWTNGQAQGRILTETAVPESVADSIEGTYETTGANPDGRMYRGKLAIRKLGEKVYLLTWTNGETGVGILAGQVLVVGYGEQPGVALYALKADGSGEGGWTTMAVEGGLGREQFYGGGGLTAVHRTKGVRPTGQPYEAAVTITKEGNTYRLAWSTGEVGIGLLTVAR